MLILAAAEANGETVDGTEACRRWLAAYGWPAAAAAWLASVLAETEAIVRGALYMDGFVFADNSMYPRSLRRAWWGMEVRDALHTWAPERAGALVLDRDRVVALLEEKNNAMRAAKVLAERVEAWDGALPKAPHAMLRTTFRRMAVWVEGFRLAAEVCLFARWCDPAHRSDGGPGTADLARFADALAALEAFAERLRPLCEDAEVRHQLVMLMDHRRLADIAREGRAALAATAGE